ncbi:MAG: class I SAM-dependent methyltransferase [Bacteroidales bacterium]|jgi:ubiquinone/menaquinone biosynthesis C-methylase UbiE|nr:class I SAM-dependent methyltransferase [Bacteroidales bacterium]
MVKQNVEKSYEKHHESGSQLSDNEILTNLKEMHDAESENQQKYAKFELFMKPKDKWLTVGDHFGVEARLLEKKDVIATASDICTVYLSVAKQQKLINDFAEQNAENMTFEAESFDFVFCRDSYHHFPRPYIAVYEMLRVAKKAVIIDEPLDPLLKMPLLMFLCNIIDTQRHPLRSTSFWKNRFSFETVGNYVYKCSPREFEKLSMGMGLPAIAFFYSNTANTVVNCKEKSHFIRKFLSACHIIPYTTITTVLFKTMPSDNEKQKMRHKGWFFYEFPKNPYL